MLRNLSSPIQVILDLSEHLSGQLYRSNASSQQNEHFAFSSAALRLIAKQRGAQIR